MPCLTGKQQYATAAAASRALSSIGARNGHKGGVWHRGPAVVIRCSDCGQWHVANSAKAVRDKRPRYEPVCDWSAA